jgi:predicted DNA-binding transcriptional regulator AlpA
MKFLTWLQIADRLSVSVSTAKRLHSLDPDFPRKVTISAGRVGFLESDFDAYVTVLQERGEAA